ncbi:MAG: hypothetical protein P8172_05325 [Gammaproteobacteria bacterium]
MERPRASPTRLIGLAALAIGVILLGHLLPLGGGSYIGQSLRDSLHGPAFFLFSAIVFRLALPSLGALRAALFAAAAVLLAAPAGETAQLLAGQKFSLHDIRQDLLGGACALLALVAHYGRREGRIDSRRARAITAGAWLLSFAVLAPVLWWTWVLAARAAAVPVIAGFEGAWEESLITAGERIEKPAGWPAAGLYVLRVATPARKYAGVRFLDPYPHWGGFTDLRFVAGTDDRETRRLAFRVHDVYHNQQYSDRFNRAFTIGPEPREFCIPLDDIQQAPDNRQMDLDAIDGMTFFLVDTDGTEVFLLDAIRLGYSATGPCRDSSGPAGPAPP